MDLRLKNLLRLVVEDVIQTREPVGSQRLVSAYGLEMSSATVRNWFMELERAGYVAQPHTSSGRVPTEKGYRLYLEELMGEGTLQQREVSALERIALATEDMAKSLRSLAEATAEATRETVVVFRDREDAFYTGITYLFAQPEFQDQGRLVAFGHHLDHLDRVFYTLDRQEYDEPTPLIGRDCPFGDECGSIMVTLQNGTVLAIVGPMRMDYRKNMAYLRMTKKLLD